MFIKDKISDKIKIGKETLFIKDKMGDKIKIGKRKE